MQISPLAQSQPVQKLFATGLHLLFVAALFAQLDEEFPHVEQRQKIAFRILEPSMRAVGRIARLERTLAWIGHRQRRRDHQHFRQHVARFRLDQHAPDARIERDARQLATDGSEFRLAIERAKFLQQRRAIGNRAVARRLDERELLHTTKAKRRQPQNHARQRRAQNLRVSKR